MNKNNLKKIILIIFFSLVICSYIIFNIIDTLRYRGGRPEEIIYTSNTKSNLDYKVYLKPNDFIDQPYLINDFSFITSLIEYIKTSFSYDFDGNSDVGINYDYYIKATIVSEYMTDNAMKVSKPVWNKDFVLLDHKQGYAPNSKIKIDEVLNIGIDYYNDLLSTFEQALNIPLSSRLDIAFIITIRGKLKDNKMLNKEHNLIMSLPLGVKAFNIDVSSNFPEQEIIYRREQRNIEISYMLVIIYIILGIVIIGIALYFIRQIMNKEQNKYDIKVNRLLKEYDDRIVNVSNFIRYEHMQIIDISNFEELLTFSDETLEPIIFWEKKSRNKREAWFSVVRNKILYRYIITCRK
jgi:hypothetical protein